MAAYREGRTLEAFLDDMWQRRAAEHKQPAVAIGNWPYRSLDEIAHTARESSNVEPIRKKRNK